MEKKIKSYEDFMKEAWDPIKKEWEKTPDGQNDHRSKDQMYYHKDEILFLWDYDKKDLKIIPNDETQEKYKNFKPLHVSGIDKEAANNIIGLLVNHPYDQWEKILNDNKVDYKHHSSEESNGGEQTARE